ncbi:MAG TPA: aldolase/citrate lyase family protein [Acidimicrobiales bacterium]|jgi:citrate lyase beta subunit
MDYVAAWHRVRCCFESPILDERKWAKIPTIPADAFMLDLEDAVPIDRKEEARTKVLEYLAQPEYFGGAMSIPRVNHLSTKWGRDDIIALAEAGIDQLMYPKTESAEDLEEVLELCRKHGSDPKIKASIESARGVIEIERIVAMDAVVVVGCGIGDLHVDTGQPLYEEDGSLSPIHYYPKLKTVMTAVAFGKAKIGFPQLPNLKDFDEYRKRAIIEKRLGFTGCSAFYPPHVEILNEVFSPSEGEVAHAHEIISLYEEAVAQGKPAALLPTGEALLVHQYKEAQNILARVDA